MINPGEFKSAWMSANELAGHLEYGDLIEFRRDGGGRRPAIYSHWAVFIERYEGKYYVAHYATEEGDFDVPVGEGVSSTDSVGMLSSKIKNGSSAEICRNELSEVAGSDPCRINNGFDAECRPLPPPIIVERANLKLGHRQYSLLFNNCEHFVKYCRYGKRGSDQALIAKSLLVGSAAFVVSGSLSVAVACGAIGYGIGMVSRSVRYSSPNFFNTLLR
ncbi:hypothetical protein AB6A40_010430 [Gnathostoma spinigerum]|uniref:LRAT domain-containing protein n=1 Tax=Gnathostoma spinigerum TaxID=75299 RepID=A0ABD6EV18_9BILA